MIIKHLTIENFRAIERLDFDCSGNINAFEKKDMSIQPRLKEAFEQLYAYTNQPNTGIRHALMDNTGSYLPGPEEALFFLVSCSAFINYLTSKFTV